MKYNNILDGTHQTTGASSLLTAIDIRRWRLIYGICRGMGRVTAIDPTANRCLQILSKQY